MINTNKNVVHYTPYIVKHNARQLNSFNNIIKTIPTTNVILREIIILYSKISTTVNK